MSPRPSDRDRELLRLYELARPGERNLAAHLREHADVVQQLGVDLDLDLDQDDAELALRLAGPISRYKRRVATTRERTQEERARAAAVAVERTARHRDGVVQVDAQLVLGALLAGHHEYISFDLSGGRVAVVRSLLLRARAGLRRLGDVVLLVDASGLHFIWRGGRGRLNLRASSAGRGRSVLHVDLARRELAPSSAPVLLADVLHQLGLM